MGSSEFAIPTLLKLLTIPELEVVEVYSKPPKPKGRGLQTVITPIHSIALQHDLSVKTPSSLKEEILQDCDVIVVVSYGLILPNSVLAHPRIAAINIHPSLLPRWRGPSPIQYTLLGGDKEAGVSIIDVTQELDAGAIYAQEFIILDGTETYSALHDRLAILGASMLCDVVRNIRNIKPIPQIAEEATYTKKLPNSVDVDFEESVEIFFRKLRVFGAVFAEAFDMRIKIVEASLSDAHLYTDELGLVFKKETKELFLQFRDGKVLIKIVQPVNKKKMPVRDFLNGISNIVNL